MSLISRSTVARSGPPPQSAASRYAAALAASALACAGAMLVSACGGGESAVASAAGVAPEQAPHSDAEESAVPLPDGPEGPAASADESAEARAASLVGHMTLDEKIQLVHGTGDPALEIGGPFPPGILGAGYIPGIPRLHIPPLATADASTGVNVAGSGATALPAPIALASSWDPEMARAYAERIATELRQAGYGVSLGGAINLAREPRSGRTFESFGEDPLLSGTMSVAHTQGTHAKHVMATVKHYAFNNQETNRFDSDSVLDERTMRETELLAFEQAVKEGKPDAVMCAYNRVNGAAACENDYLLNTVLKNAWGFKGYVQSDGGATHSTVASALAGLDEEQPGDAAGQSLFGDALKAAVESGKVPQGRLDDMVKRKLTAMIETGVMDDPPQQGGRIDRAAGNADALRFARQSFVLLKNGVPARAQQPVLPLSRDNISSIAVIGGRADSAVLAGGGSASTPPADGNAVPDCTGETVLYINSCAIWYKSSPLDAIKARAPHARITYVDGTNAAAAASAAAQADVAIVFATQWESEGSDLPSLALPDPKADKWNERYDQNALIAAVAARAKRTVIVLENGSPVLMPWLDKVDGVLEAWYPGVQGGPAIADALFGDVNPSGKLPLTFPRRDRDLPQPKIDAGNSTVVYREGLLMGYRWFDAKRIKPLFPFGFGLSYTTFRYSGMTLEADASNDVTVSFTVMNAGQRVGTETMQVYAGLPSGLGEPPQRLVGWQKVTLEPRQAQRVQVKIPAQRFATWDAGKQTWVLNPGDYRLIAAASSRDPDAMSRVVRLPIARHSAP